LKNYKTIISFLIFTVLLALPPLLLKIFADGELLTPHFWLIFAFMSAITLLVIMAVLVVQQQNSEMYAQAFMGATTFKLLSCLVFVLVIIKKTHPDKYIFMLDFAYLYSLNTVFEIYGLLRNLRNQNLK